MGAEYLVLIVGIALAAYAVYDAKFKKPAATPKVNGGRRTSDQHRRGGDAAVKPQRRAEDPKE